MRDKKTFFYLNKTPKDFTNSKNFWEFYQSSLKIKSDKSSNNCPDSIIFNNELITDAFEITNKFNTHFASFASDSSVSDNDSRKFTLNSFQSMMKMNSSYLNNENFEFAKVTHDEVLDLLKFLEPSTSPGISGLPVIILKEARSKLVDPLVDIFNSCIDQKTFIGEWKIALVSPLYKSKGDINDVNNYRGISVLPPLAKIFEKLLASRIRDYFN